MLTKNTEKLKQRVAEHVAADSIVQGIYWDTGSLRGCFIGCLAHAADPTLNEVDFGLPVAVQRIAENIFEALPANEAKAFFAALPAAIERDGKDLSKVHWQFLAAELRSLPPQDIKVQEVIDPVIAGMDLLAQGLDWHAVAAAAAAAADAAAWAADTAADAAAWAADTAAGAAAADAADWAYGAAARAARAADAVAAAAAAAADAAAWAADTAADADAADAADTAARDVVETARLNARLRQRDLLLQLIKDAPVVGGAR